MKLIVIILITAVSLAFIIRFVIPAMVITYYVHCVRNFYKKAKTPYANDLIIAAGNLIPYMKKRGKFMWMSTEVKDGTVVKKKVVFKFKSGRYITLVDPNQ